MSKLDEREAKAAAAKERKSFVHTMVEDTPNKAEEESEKFTQRSYYLSERLLKAITLKTAEGELDKSGVVREALEIYLADILKKMD